MSQGSNPQLEMIKGHVVLNMMTCDVENIEEEGSGNPCQSLVEE